jgi:hypothetical protein
MVVSGSQPKERKKAAAMEKKSKPAEMLQGASGAFLPAPPRRGRKKVFAIFDRPF